MLAEENFLDDISSTYSRAIDILFAEAGPDPRQLMIELAKESPKLFVKLVERLNERKATAPTSVYEEIERTVEKQPSKASLSDLSPLDSQLVCFYQSNMKVEAIKRCRQETGMGLKEAKDYCDKLWDDFTRGRVS